MKLDSRDNPALARHYQVVDRRDCSEIRGWIAADEETGAVLVLRKAFNADVQETPHFPHGIRITPRPHR